MNESFDSRRRKLHLANLRKKSSFARNRSFQYENHFVKSLRFAIRGKLTFGFGMDLEGKELDPFLVDIEQ